MKRRLQMRKTVTVINDELGTIALGFARAGYEIETIYLDASVANAVQICVENWAENAKIASIEELDEEKEHRILNTDCIAGKLFFPTEKTRYGRRDTEQNRISLEMIRQSLRMIQKIRPEKLLFHINKTSLQSLEFNRFTEELKGLGYAIQYERIESEQITGYPVKEGIYFLFATRSNAEVRNHKIYAEMLPEKSIWEFLDKTYDTKLMADLYQDYQINGTILERVGKVDRNTVLCWDRDVYRQTDQIVWNSRFIPLIVQENHIRKITHREVARLKGIPEEYSLPVRNRSWLYQRLMNCANVLVVQKAAWTLDYDGESNGLERSRVTKQERFQEIIGTYLKRKDISYITAQTSTEEKRDFVIDSNGLLIGVTCTLYKDNKRVERQLLRMFRYCCYHNNRAQETENIILMANNMDSDLKRKMEKEYPVHIWDVRNLLWLLAEFPQLQNEFISLLSFSVSDIIPEEPYPVIWKTRVPVREKVDLQERLRRIRPGKEEAGKYEKLCAEIVRYLFSNNIEFIGEQETTEEGLYRFDYCGKIKHGNTNEFFSMIKEYFRTKYVIFEFKNNTQKITQKEIYTTEKYLYETALRKVAIIISRKGADENADKAIRGSLRESGKLILCLSDEDIHKMILMKMQDQDPGDYLEDQIDKFMMKLEK